jgi:PPM family protein phosphatase
MTLIINESFSFTGIGKRENNEDAIFPESGIAETNNNLFIVCDGMGGADQGEVASKISCDESVNIFFKNNNGVTEQQILELLNNIDKKLTTYLSQNPFVNRMGTTLAMLKFQDGKAAIMHIGDSRVYHIRNGKIIFKTNDHRQINEMIKEGLITFEQAKTHPWRNKLSNAILCQSNKKTNFAKPEINLIDIIKSEDYFFLCSDGVNESITDEMLVKILNSDLKNEQKVNEIVDICSKESKDNFSGHLLQITIPT